LAKPTIFEDGAEPHGAGVGAEVIERDAGVGVLGGEDSLTPRR
jgi:hypothetical protein